MMASYFYTFLLVTGYHLIAGKKMTKWDEKKISAIQHTVAIPKIISVKNARAWVSMISYLKK